MVTTPQFLVMVDGRVEETRLLDVIRGRLPDCELYRRGSVHVRGNLLEINANEDADPELAITDDDGYLYYRWRVEVTHPTRQWGRTTRWGWLGRSFKRWRALGSEPFSARRLRTDSRDWERFVEALADVSEWVMAGGGQMGHVGKSALVAGWKP